MKKLALTLAIVLGLGMASFAQGGLFGRGSGDSSSDLNMPGLPPQHNMDDNVSAGSNPAPLGTGAFMLISLGAAYAMTKKNKK